MASSLQCLNNSILHNTTTHHQNQPFFSNHNDTVLFFKPKKNFVQTNLITCSSSLSTSSSSFSSSSSSSSYSSSTSTTTPPSPSCTSLDLLVQHLSTKNYRLADDETRRLLIAFAGEQAQKRGYVFFSEVQFISPSDLKAIDELWLEHSNGRFGYSVQKKVWQKVRRDFTRFFMRVGWMKKLDTEVEQFNYRAFPTEFYWEMEVDGVQVPEGHLPLTNALRGTQLLGSIFTHPAFEDVVVGEEEGKSLTAGGDSEGKAEETRKIGGLGFGGLKTDYSF